MDSIIPLSVNEIIRINAQQILDGNKRTGMLVAVVFLNVNCYQVTLSNNIMFDLGLAFATSEVSYSAVAEIFK